MHIRFSCLVSNRSGFKDRFNRAFDASFNKQKYTMPCITKGALKGENRSLIVVDEGPKIISALKVKKGDNYESFIHSPRYSAS